MTTSAVKPPPASTSQAQRIISRGPLFGGYTVVAFVAAWLVGIVLRAGDILPPDAAPWTWLALAGACAMLAMLAALLTPLLVQSRLRLFYLALRFLLMIGILGVFLALLIGILLGLKTPVLRSRLALFTATGTIHLVVPAGLKVSILADAATRAFRPFGRWPRVIGSRLAPMPPSVVADPPPCSRWPRLWVASTTSISPSRSPSLV